MNSFAARQRLADPDSIPPRLGAAADAERAEAVRPVKLTLQDISKHFTGNRATITALSRVNLAVREGEFACIVGPSGCGKTTLLNLVAELEKPDAGRIVINGTAGASHGQRLMIFQEAALFPWLTVLENVAFGLKIRGIPGRQREAMAMEALSLVKLDQFATSCIHELSGGMKQRVALARALVMQPEVLLMDEPFSSLDVQAKELLYQELQDAWRLTGTTILFITHDVEEAVYLGERVVIMTGRPGRIRGEHRIDLSRPRDRNGARFIQLCDLISSQLMKTGETAMA